MDLFFTSDPNAVQEDEASDAFNALSIPRPTVTPNDSPQRPGKDPESIHAELRRRYAAVAMQPSG